MESPSTATRLGAMTVTFEMAPRPTTVAEVPRAVDAWTSSEAMRALVRAFGSELPRSHLHARLKWLDEFSSVWDYRSGGTERDQQDRAVLTGEQADVALHAAAALGLMDDTASMSGDFDHVVVLGGLVRGCFNRMRAASSLLREGQLRTASVFALTGFRPLSGSDGAAVRNPPSEVEIARSMGFEAIHDEFEAMDAAVRHYFDRGSPDVRDGVDSDDRRAAWRLHSYLPVGPQPMIRTLAAPSTDPSRRANTADGLSFLAGVVEPLSAESSVLLVTTAIYAPYQGAVALRVLSHGHGASVTTLGVAAAGASDVHARFDQAFDAGHYLAEIRSAIRGYRALVEEVVTR